MQAPSKSRVTPGYGYGSTLPPYSKSNPHAGVDFQHSPDPYIYAPEDGKITARSYMGDCGQAAELTAGNNKHRFCHASEWYIANGQTVTKGQRIGKMGETGAAQGVHLHWILWVKGNRVDGMNYVNEKGDDMFEGKSAQEWAIQAKDAEQYKQQVIKSAPWTRGMGMKVGNVQFIIDDLQKFKDETLAKPSGSVDVQINGTKYVPEKG